jgi:hypothetical protein
MIWFAYSIERRLGLVDLAFGDNFRLYVTAGWRSRFRIQYIRLKTFIFESLVNANALPSLTKEADLFPLRSNSRQIFKLNEQSKWTHSTQLTHPVLESFEFR